MDYAHILVVDDDERLRDLLQRYLRQQGFVVTAAHNADAAQDSLRDLRVDAIILDVMMPGRSGIELITELRQNKNAHPLPPILLLTAMAEAADRVHGLESGAQDYLVKPFEPRELLLRIQNMLRLPTAVQPQMTLSAVKFGDFCFYPDTARLSKTKPDQSKNMLHLTAAETRLLEYFARNARQIISRDQLAKILQVSAQGRSLDVQIMRLRRKIEAQPRHPVFLQTCRGQGYIFHPDDVVWETGGKS